MEKPVRISIPLSLMASFGLFAFRNGWPADIGDNNRIAAMVVDLQRWPLAQVGPQGTAGVFAVCALLIAWVGLLNPGGKREAA